MNGNAVFLDFTAMTTIALTADSINALDLSPIQTVVDPLLQEGIITTCEQQLQFKIEYSQAPDDPRELPEIPEVRLWFIRLDALYPWLPFLLDWKAGELTRYTAMLVPHQFHPKDGIQYNPEALEIFVMHKIFVLATWMQQQGMDGNARLKAMTQMFGYEIDSAFFDLL